MPPVAVIVNWYGPYTCLSSFKVAMRGWSTRERILYMALGKHNIVRYIGMTQSPQYRFSNHRKLEDPDNVTFYIGNIVTQRPSGRRPSRRAPDLKIAEHILIRSIQPTLNTQQVGTVPGDCVSVYSRFFKPDNMDETHDPLRKFPSIVTFDPSTEKITTVRY